MAAIVFGLRDQAISAGKRVVKKGKHSFVQKRFKRVYDLVADYDSDEDDVLALSQIPQIYSEVNGAKCKAQSANEMGRTVHPVTGLAAIRWEVICEFDSDFDTPENEEDQPPESRTPKIRWYGEQEEEALEKDAIEKDKAIETKNGEPLITTTWFPICVLEIERYTIPPFNPLIQLRYAAKVNSVDFWGAPEGTALMMPIEAEEGVYINNNEYVRETYRIKFKMKPDPDNPEAFMKDTWMARLLHHGFKVLRYNEAGSLKLVVATDGKGNPITVNLDENGHDLPEGQDPVFLAFNRFAKVDFNELNLGPFR